jgi:hypothetical protein
MAGRVPDVTAPRARPGQTRAREAVGRVVVMGYSHIATNESLALGFQARFANADLITASIGWLTARRELVEIPARPVSASALNVSASDARWIFLYVVFAIPLSVTFMAIAVWARRRSTDR